MCRTSSFLKMLILYFHTFLIESQQYRIFIFSGDNIYAVFNHTQSSMNNLFKSLISNI